MTSIHQRLQMAYRGLAGQWTAGTGMPEPLSPIRLLRTAFQAAGGHKIEAPGDGFFVAFSRASDGVTAAVAAQRALAAHPWPDGDRPGP